jgi:hypothetical protein
MYGPILLEQARDTRHVSVFAAECQATPTEFQYMLQRIGKR